MIRFHNLFLLIAGSLDAFFTDLGLQKGLIQEANPLMNLLYQQSPIWFYLAKIILPCMLFLLIPVIRQKTCIKHVLTFTSIIYFDVLILHAFWIITYWKVISFY